MEKYIEALGKTKIFIGVGKNELSSMLSCLSARVRSYKGGEYVLRQGDKVSDICILVEGELHIQKDDYWGNRSIVSRIGLSEMFGEAYIAPESGPLINDVVATRDSVVVFFDVMRIMTTCSSACSFHSAVIKNLLFAIAEKNRRLVRKIEHISRRTTREKLVSYLSEVASAAGSSGFDVPFNRQQLADFLSVDRSAMSSELCKMRDEGLLRFRKNHFELL